MDNALKFTSKGVVSVDIDIERKKKREQQDYREEGIVTVEDTGSGINPEIFPRLFTKFSTKSFSGTGLGLYISKKIIEAHGGKILGQNNDQGKDGATFSFSLPLHQTKKMEVPIMYRIKICHLKLIECVDNLRTSYASGLPCYYDTKDI